MKIPAVPVLLSLSLLGLFGCATTGKMTDEQKLSFYQAHAGEPVQDFRYFGRLNGWTPLGNNALSVSTKPSEAYLLELSGPCHDLEYATAITISQFGGQVSARFDSVTPLGGGAHGMHTPCRIDTIRPLDVKAMRDSQKELREAATVEREAKS